MASNRSLAEYNLSQQPILEAKKNALFEAHRNKAVIQEMYEEYRKKLGKYLLSIAVSELCY